MSRRTPTDDTTPAERRKQRLHDPADSNHFDPAIADDITTDLAVVPPRDAAVTADPPATPDVTASESSDGSSMPPAGSGGGSGRPDLGPPYRTVLPSGAVTFSNYPIDDPEQFEAEQRRPSPGRSIGRVIANTAIDAALGVPVQVQDEMAHGREATDLLVTAAADHWRHNELMPYARLLDLEAVVAHMVEARKVVR